MKLFICDINKISSYQLPDKVEDFYMVDYTYGNSFVTETITLNADNGFWTLYSDESITIYSLKKIQTGPF